MECMRTTEISERKISHMHTHTENYILINLPELKNLGQPTSEKINPSNQPQDKSLKNY